MGKKTRQTSVNINSCDMDILREHAERLDVTLSWLIRKAVRSYVESKCFILKDTSLLEREQFTLTMTPRGMNMLKIHAEMKEKVTVSVVIRKAVKKYIDENILAGKT